MRIDLIAGCGDAYGTGHSVRMNILLKLLTERSIDSRCIYINEGFDFPFSQIPDLYFLDARDLDPGPFLEKASVIALDNRHPTREKLENSHEIRFHDTIPHPDADLTSVMQNCLISPSLKKRDLPEPDFDRALIYSSLTFDVESLDKTIISLISSGRLKQAIRIGGPTLIDSCSGVFRHEERLDADDFAFEISRAGFVFTHFGITLLEAWFRNCFPILYTTHSPIHNSLARYLADAAGVHIFKIINEDFKLPDNNEIEVFRKKPGPTGNGYERLIDIIHKMIEL